MSVLIKGIKMPKCCVGCPCFYDFISCQALPVGAYDFSINGFDEYKERLPNCPLIEIDEAKIDTQEERHGHWTLIDKGHHFYDWECSICGRSGRGDYAFCPRCGAVMDEDIPIEYFENGGI